MPKNCTDTTSVSRSGSSQLQRVMNALLPASAPVDERDYADLLLFAKRYAAYITNYNELNVADGDWQPLMSMDVSVTLAGIAKTDVEGYADYVRIIYNNINAAGTENERKKYFKSVFDFIFSVIIELDGYFRQIPAELEFKEYYSSSIQARLQEPLQRLINYYNDFITANYIDNSSTFIAGDVPLAITLSQNFSINAISPVWKSPVVFPPIALSVPDPVNVSNSIYHIITHNLFNAQLDTFFKSLSSFVSQSAFFLEQTLTNFSSHTPHYALFISFLHLFKKAQGQLNQFTGRHLDFHYKDVLRLQTKKAEPDSAHIVVELQKGIAQHLLKQGTLFKGGKDVDGKEISYAANEETVINRASVKALQSVYVQLSSYKGKNFETVYASPVANSEDGQGAKLTSASGEWFSFGDVAKMKEATFGFMIASHYLYLNEGDRSITVKLFFADSLTLTAPDLANAFTIQLTGKKGWYDVATYKVDISAAAKTIAFEIELEGDAPAIVGYTAKIHKETYLTDLPVVRFYLQNIKNEVNPYAQLKSLSLQKIGLEVSVEGAKDLIVQNDEGALDPAKPFKPFGSQPKVGSSFIIGSKEIFQKKLTHLNLVIDWDDVPDSLVDQMDEALHEYERTLNYIDMKRKFHTVKTSVLQKGQWRNLDVRKGMFIEDTLYKDIYDWTRPEVKYAGKLSATDVEHNVIAVSTVNIHPGEKTYDKNIAYANTSVDGFVKLELNHPDFGHTAYPEAVRNAAMNVKVTVTDEGGGVTSMSVVPGGSVPKEPYTPSIKSFSVSYKAATEIQLQSTAATLAGEGAFYHVTPFGYAAINNKLQTSVTALPDYENEGELYVGLENVLPSTTLKILFQVSDGTSNPLKPENLVEWSYLSANNWKRFSKSDVIDTTNNLTQSGIVTFVFKEDIITGNSLFDTSLSWIKAAVKTDSDAVCKLISVKAQALKVTLVQDDLNKLYFKQILPANTISKLLVADAAVKKISQPYESFGGRVAEKSEQFYTRVSERLRHKQRAISAWDYERLVLEKFPFVYKAKCINHTGLIPTKVTGVTKYSETIPGQVTVVTIPDLRNHSYKNALKPYTSVGLLTNIRDYLLKLVSPFVKLHVLNPKFEEVQFEFNVVIVSPLDVTFYVNQLSLDIERFLCPWAFANEKEIEFGGKISKSVVLNFIEERSYVDYVTCYKMHHFIDRGTGDQQQHYDVEEAITTTGISILVSYYDEITNTRHKITGDKPCDC